jgi:hypothetical protein
MGWLEQSPPPVAASMETSFRQEGNARALRDLAARKDINGLLDYALLLNTMYGMECSKGQWLMGELLRQTVPPVTADHERMAAELLNR